jgi:hypothetical protein
MNKKHTQEDFYNVIYEFHNNDYPSQTVIAKSLKLGVAYVCNTLAKYLDNKMNLGELARNTRSRNKFIAICLESE